jgi:dihydroorotate dehydrogenase
LYRSVLRPALFRLPAEAAHRLALAALHLPLPWHLFGGSVSDPRLEVSIGELLLPNPVGLAAGFDKDCRVLGSLGKLGFGYLVGGTVTAARRTGNAKPRIGRIPEQRSLLNSMGFPNHGAVAAAGELARLRKTAPTLVSISDARVGDLIRAHELLEPHVDGFELNVSCPNVAWGRDHDTEHLLRASLAALRTRTDKCLFVKTPPYRESREREAVLALVRIAQEFGVHGISPSNTLPVAAPGLAVGRAGLSGKAVFQDTVRIVRDLYQATEGTLAVNACGGIFTAEDALTCVRAGATTVQVYTGFIYEGPRIVRNITAGLIGALGEGRERVSALVGSAA